MKPNVTTGSSASDGRAETTAASAALPITDAAASRKYPAALCASSTGRLSAIT